jgi:hypothetical protein
MKWPWSGAPVIPPPSSLPRVPFPQGYTLNKWQSSPDLVAGWKNLAKEDLFRHGMSVLYNSIPSGYPARGQQVNDTMANIELGRYQGYMDCLNLLQALAFDAPKSEEAPMDWNAQPD